MIVVVLLLVADALAVALAGLAAWYQLQGAVLWTALASIAVAGTLTAVLACRGRRAGAAAVLAAGALAGGLWWSSILPSDRRDWTEDVAHGVTARIEGDEAILANVRAFEWRSETDFTPRWQTQRYRLDQIVSADLFTSTWGMPAIAHTLVSFGFADGQRVAFSAEIRRERGEEFSEIGGFFKQFELVLIAAQERDIIRLRTTIRSEQVSLFPLRLSAEQRRALFVSYLQLGNELAAQPMFYHTATANCTTVIFRLARLVEPGMPLDWRILLSGYLPDYLYRHGIVRTDIPLDQMKAQALVSERGKAAGDGADFAERLRAPTP